MQKLLPCFRRLVVRPMEPQACSRSIDPSHRRRRFEGEAPWIQEDADSLARHQRLEGRTHEPRADAAPAGIHDARRLTGSCGVNQGVQPHTCGGNPALRSRVPQHHLLGTSQANRRLAIRRIEGSNGRLDGPAGRWWTQQKRARLAQTDLHSLPHLEPESPAETASQPRWQFHAIPSANEERLLSKLRLVEHPRDLRPPELDDHDASTSPTGAGRSERRRAYSSFTPFTRRANFSPSVSAARRQATMRSRKISKYSITLAYDVSISSVSSMVPSCGRTSTRDF